MTEGGGQVSGATPPEQVNVTVTSDLFHPAPLGAGAAEAEMVNAVEGVKVTGMDAVVAFPATSVACTTIVFAPWTSVTLHDKAVWVNVAGAPLHVTLAMPDSESVIVPETVVGKL